VYTVYTVYTCIMKRYVVHLTKAQIGILNVAIENTMITMQEGGLGATQTQVNTLSSAQSALFEGRSNGLKTINPIK